MKKKFKFNFQQGEIATIIALGSMAFILVTTLISRTFVQKPQTTFSKAATTTNQCKGGSYMPAPSGKPPESNCEQYCGVGQCEKCYIGTTDKYQCKTSNPTYGASLPACKGGTRTFNSVTTCTAKGEACEGNPDQCYQCDMSGTHRYYCDLSGSGGVRSCKPPPTETICGNYCCASTQTCVNKDAKTQTGACQAKNDCVENLKCSTAQDTKFYSRKVNKYYPNGYCLNNVTYSSVNDACNIQTTTGMPRSTGTTGTPPTPGATGAPIEKCELTTCGNLQTTDFGNTCTIENPSDKTTNVFKIKEENSNNYNYYASPDCEAGYIGSDEEAKSFCRCMTTAGRGTCDARRADIDWASDSCQYTESAGQQNCGIGYLIYEQKGCQLFRECPVSNTCRYTCFKDGNKSNCSGAPDPHGGYDVIIVSNNTNQILYDVIITIDPGAGRYRTTSPKTMVMNEIYTIDMNEFGYSCAALSLNHVNAFSEFKTEANGISKKGPDGRDGCGGGVKIMLNITNKDLK